MIVALKTPSSSDRLLTAADLVSLPDELPTGPVLYELDNGRLIIMTPPGDIHGAVELNIGTELKIQGERRGLGKARSGDVGIVLWRNPDRVVGADAAFIAQESLPIQVTKEGFLETIPDLVVEVKSKNDTKKKVLAKVRDYLKAGVRLVWVLDPKARTVTAYRPRQKQRVFRENALLTAEEIIPGFQVSVRSLFEL